MISIKRIAPIEKPYNRQKKKQEQNKRNTKSAGRKSHTNSSKSILIAMYDKKRGAPTAQACRVFVLQ